jgi:signal transduction histidine kinase
VSGLLPLLRRRWFDAAIGMAIALGIAWALLGLNGGSHSRWFEAAAALVIISPLFARKRFPVGAPVAVGIALAAASFVDHGVIYELAPALAGVAAVFLVGMAQPPSRSFAGLAVAFVVVGIAAHNDPGGGVDDFAVIALALTPCWLLGMALRRKHDEAELAVADERARIARELHDIVGHSVSVMTVQAAAVRRLLRSDQERERAALLAVERTGREALAEMRRMVGVLRRSEEAEALAPQPSLRDVDALVEKARHAGLPVDLQVEGAPVELPPGVDLAAYRVVQEGLTNALNHARATRAEVKVRYRDGEVEVSVANDGRADSSVDEAGHGLVGMRERVAVYGGEIEAGPQPAGWFRLRVTLPAPPT